MILKPTAVDTIIQSSTVELMRCHSVSVAPRPRTDPARHIPDAEIAGVTRFDAPGIGGCLTLIVPRPVYELMTRQHAHPVTHAEWIYELTNQVMGRIRNRLIQFQVNLRTQVPEVLSGAALERHKRRVASEVLYFFGTLRGDISISVDASLTRAVLKYTNAPLVISETDLVLFE